MWIWTFCFSKLWIPSQHCHSIWFKILGAGACLEATYPQQNSMTNIGPKSNKQIIELMMKHKFLNKIYIELEWLGWRHQLNVIPPKIWILLPFTTSASIPTWSDISCALSFNINLMKCCAKLPATPGHSTNAIFIIRPPQEMLFRMSIQNPRNNLSSFNLN